MAENEGTSSGRTDDGPRRHHPQGDLTARQKEIVKILEAIEREEAKKVAASGGRQDAPKGKTQYINQDERTPIERCAVALEGYYDAVDLNKELLRQMGYMRMSVDPIIKALGTSSKKVTEEKSTGLHFIGGQEAAIERMLSASASRISMIQMMIDMDGDSLERLLTLANILENTDLLLFESRVIVKPSTWNKSFLVINRSTKLVDTPFSDTATALGKKGISTMGDLKVLSVTMDKLSMIQYLRDTTGYGLAQAKYFCEVVDMLPLPPLPEIRRLVDEIKVSDTIIKALTAKSIVIVADIKKILNGSTGKVDGIKKIVSATGLSLSEAKALYEALEAAKIV